MISLPPLYKRRNAPHRLTESELSSMVAWLIVTGHEPLVNLIGNGALALLRHPAHQRYLQAQPGFMTTTVEELLPLYKGGNEIICWVLLSLGKDVV